LVLVLVTALLMASSAAAQEPPRQDESPGPYPFIVLDSPPYFFTMRQVNQDYLSGYRLFAKTLNTHLNPAFSVMLQGAACLLFLKTMTHEQGHQAILAAEHIESHQRSFPFMERAGYVDGVTDAALQNLRDTKFPTFARLHTAGVESDYMLATREETLMAFGDEVYRNVVVDYLLRKSAVILYLTEGVFERDTDGAQESDELKRDIVGNDIYGVIRHWFRPAMAFTRYTRYADLTTQEHEYLERIQWRALFNLANANIVGIQSFRLTDDLRANVGMAHALGPFGDFIDERVWLNYRSSVKVSGYVREFENRDRWFVGAGAGIYDYPLTDRLRASATLHYWKQPVGLSFTSTTGKSGGAVDLGASYRVATSQGPHPQSLSLDVGMIYKTEGFLPEEVALVRHFGVRVGLTVGLHF
jgi:hypothetical protein